MPFIEDAKSLYTHAVRNNYIMLATHMFGEMSALRAILEAAEEEDSPVIVQAMDYINKDYEPMPKFFEYFKAVCSQYKVPILFNHDHIHTVEESLKAIDAGFPSLMYDGSDLPFEENIANTKKVVDYAHSRGVWVEAELGNIPGFEHDLSTYHTSTVYTDPQKAAEFIERTGCDSLTIAVGTAHGGFRGDGTSLPIDYDLLAELRKAVGPDFPFVLHGAAQLPEHLVDFVNKYGGDIEYLDMCSEETIAKTRFHGVAKTNMDVDNWLVVTGTIRKFFLEKPDIFNFMIYRDEAMGEMKKFVKHLMKDVVKSSGFGSKYLKG